MESASQPSLNFTDTGSLVSETSVCTISRIFFLSFIKAEPAPVFTTLGTGQPQFTSIQVGLYFKRFGMHRLKGSLSGPKSCTTSLSSPRALSNSSFVFSLSLARPSAETISVTAISAPIHREISLIALSV